MSRSERRSAQLSFVALAACAVVVNLVAPVGAVRTLVTLAAALLVPGAAIASQMVSLDVQNTVAVAIGLSLAVETVVALAMVWVPWWHPRAAAGLLIGLSLLVLCFGLIRNRGGTGAGHRP
jgi:uncharacterized membrane protein